MTYRIIFKSGKSVLVPRLVAEGLNEGLQKMLTEGATHTRTAVNSEFAITDLKDVSAIYLEEWPCS